MGYSTFYNKLEPFGAWIETSDYGYVWQPRQAESSRSWRPYMNGRWVYTDAGWTWISEEAFGWATYHYGRWTRLRGVGWVWVPGNEWAPAWVSWRKSNDYVGWAPLPPEARFDQRTGIHNWSDSYYDIGPDQYCFVPSREFGTQRIETTIVPPERNVTIVNQTTNVTNITYNNTTIVNEGPSYDEVRAVSREPVQRLRLERNLNVDVAVEQPRPVVRGETVVVAAPVIAAPVVSERPPTVKQTIAQAAVDLGWAAIANQDEAKKAREKIKSEATPPSNAPAKKFVKAAATTSTTTPGTETSATSTPEATAPSPRSRSTAASPVGASTKGAAATPTQAVTERQRAPARATQTPEPSATPTPTSTPSASVARSPSLAPTETAMATPRTRAVETPEASATITPHPRLRGAEDEAPSGTRPEMTPRDHPTSTATPSPRSTFSPSAAVAASPAEKLSKKERKELNREEKRELKHERGEGAQRTESPSQSPSPESSR